MIALRAADYQFAVAVQADTAGAYRLDLPPGNYKVGFVDPEGHHAMGWFDQVPYSGLVDATTVAAPGTADASLDPTTGSVSGTVVDDPNGSPVACAWVAVIGSGGNIAGAAVADADGGYTVSGLPVGSYRATMVDPLSGRIQEYWDNSLSYSGSTPFSVAPGATTTVDGALALPAPFGHPTQWVAKQFTEILGRALSAAEWATWTSFYAAQPACTAAALTALPRYLAGVATPTTPGLLSSPSAEFAGLYPATTAIDRATRAAAVSRAALSHDPNDNDWTAFIKPYVQGTATWASTVNGSTAAERTVTLGVGEVVRVGGAANANQQLVVPPGVTLTSEGAPGSPHRLTPPRPTSRPAGLHTHGWAVSSPPPPRPPTRSPTASSVRGRSVTAWRWSSSRRGRTWRASGSTARAYRTPTTRWRTSRRRAARPRVPRRL